MQGLDLTDAAMRLQWAQADSKALVDSMINFRESDPYTTWLHQKGDRWYWTFRRVASPEDEAEALTTGARVFGTFLDHMRAALNYLVYQVAELSLREDPTLQGKLRPASTEFPIFKSGTLFRKQNRIKQLPEKHLSRFRQVQPYKGGNNGLWILQELAGQYRHSLIHPVAMHPFGSYEGLFSEVMPRSADDVEIIYTGGLLKDGDDLCSFRAPGPMNPDDYPKIVIAVGVSHPECEGLTLIDVLNAINAEVIAILNDWNGVPLMVMSDPYPA